LQADLRVEDEKIIMSPSLSNLTVENDLIVKYQTEIRNLQIQLGTSEAENRGLRVEVEELRSLLSTFTAN
jgi:regulator of replication initiation timing